MKRLLLLVAALAAFASPSLTRPARAQPSIFVAEPEHYSVLSWRAIPSDGKDDAPQFRNLIASLGARTRAMVIPAGTFDLFSSVSVPANITVWYLTGSVVTLHSPATFTVAGNVIDFRVSVPGAGGGGAISFDQLPAGASGFNPKSYGAKGNAKVLTGTSIASGSSTLIGSGFSSDVVGRQAVVLGAGPLVGTPPVASELTTTIAAYVDATHVTLAATATTTVATGAGTVYYGSDDRAAFQSAIDAAYAAGGKVVITSPVAGCHYLLSPANPTTSHEVLAIPGSVQVEGPGWSFFLWFSAAMSSTCDGIRFTTGPGGRFGGGLKDIDLEPMIPLDGRNGVHYDFSDTITHTAPYGTTSIIGAHLVDHIKTGFWGDCGIKVSNGLVTDPRTGPEKTAAAALGYIVGDPQLIPQYTGGLFTTTIRNCYIYGHNYGINLDHAGDNIALENNTFPLQTLYNPDEIAIRADLVTLALKTTTTPRRITGVTTTALAGGCTVGCADFATAAVGTFVASDVGRFVAIAGAGLGGQVFRGLISSVGGTGATATFAGYYTSTTVGGAGEEAWVYNEGQDGAHQFTVHKNNFSTPGGSVLLTGGNSFKITENNMENVELNTSACDAMICIDGSSSLRAKHGLIKDNHIAGNTWMPLYVVRVIHGVGIIIKDNNIIDSGTYRDMIASTATGGTWTYSFTNTLGCVHTSAPIPYNATADEVKTAIGLVGSGGTGPGFVAPCTGAETLLGSDYGGGSSVQVAPLTGGGWRVSLKKLYFYTSADISGLTGGTKSYVRLPYRSIFSDKWAIGTTAEGNTYPGGTQNSARDIEDQGQQGRYSLNQYGLYTDGSSEARATQIKWAQGYNQVINSVPMWILQPTLHGGADDMLAQITSDGRLVWGGAYADAGMGLQANTGANVNRLLRVNGGMILTGRPSYPALSIRTFSAWTVTPSGTGTVTVHLRDVNGVTGGAAGASFPASWAWNANAATVATQLNTAIAGFGGSYATLAFPAFEVTDVAAAGSVAAHWYITSAITEVDLIGSTYTVTTSKVRPEETFRLGIADPVTGMVTWSAEMAKGVAAATMQTQLNLAVGSGGWGTNSCTVTGVNPWTIKMKAGGFPVPDGRLATTETVAQLQAVLGATDLSTTIFDQASVNAGIVRFGPIAGFGTDGSGHTRNLQTGTVEIMANGTHGAYFTQYGFVPKATNVDLPPIPLTRAMLVAVPYSAVTVPVGTVLYCTDCQHGAVATAGGPGAVCVKDSTPQWWCQ